MTLVRQETLFRYKGRHFVCRIKASSRKTELSTNPVTPDSHVFYDARVLLGTKDINRPHEKFVWSATRLMVSPIGSPPIASI